MKKNKLGKTDIMVSEICLGSMTWGQQNSEQEAHEQLSFAIEKGINFIDTAEMYAVPPKKETYGLTESYIGSWLINQDRSKIILATKLAGRTSNMPSGPPGLDWIRNGPRLNKNHIFDKNGLPLNYAQKKLIYYCFANNLNCSFYYFYYKESRR